MAIYVQKTFSLVARGNYNPFTPIITYIETLKDDSKLQVAYRENEREPLLVLVHVDDGSGNALNAEVIGWNSRRTAESALTDYLAALASSRTVSVHAMNRTDSTMALLIIDSV